MRTAHEVFLNEDNYGVTRLDAVEFQEKDTKMQGHSIWHVANGARPAAQACSHPDRSLATGFSCSEGGHHHYQVGVNNPDAAFSADHRGSHRHFDNANRMAVRFRGSYYGQSESSYLGRNFQAAMIQRDAEPTFFLGASRLSDFRKFAGRVCNTD